MNIDAMNKMISAIKNACMVGYRSCEVKYSKLNLAILGCLKKDGYITDFEEGKDRKILVKLKYDDENISVIRCIKCISKPGRKLYVNLDEIKRNRFGIEMFATTIVSTNRGVMSYIEAKNLGIGGQVLMGVVS